MIYATVRCSWCDTHVDMAPSFSDFIVVSDDVMVVEHQGESYAFCSDSCRDAAIAQLDES